MKIKQIFMSDGLIHKKDTNCTNCNCRNIAQPFFLFKNYCQNWWRTYRTKSTSGGHILRVFDQFKQLGLLQRGLTGGQPPRLRQDLNIKGNIQVQSCLTEDHSKLLITAWRREQMHSDHRHFVGIFVKSLRVSIPGLCWFTIIPWWGQFTTATMAALRAEIKKPLATTPRTSLRKAESSPKYLEIT